MRKYIVMGVQGSGKGTQARMLKDDFDLVHISVGDLFRWHDWNHGFILDGFPRNVTQARFFLESYDIDAVILIEVPEEVVFERMLSRRLCSRCGLDYNLIAHRPAVPGTCDVCHGALVSRPDDTPEAIRGRLRDYDEKTRPIVELFRHKELVITSDGTRDPLEVQADIRQKLGLPPHAEAPGPR